jgi:hypothetical protein
LSGPGDPCSTRDRWDDGWDVTHLNFFDKSAGERGADKGLINKISV